MGKKLFLWVLIIISLIACAYVPEEKMSVMDVAFRNSTIGDVYSKIGVEKDSVFAPYEIICKAQKLYDGMNDTKTMVVWPVWHRPDAIVSSDAECTSDPKIVNNWIFGEKYREIGTSAFVPFPNLALLGQFQPEHAYVFQNGGWCRAANVGFIADPYQEIAFENAIFEVNEYIGDPLNSMYFVYVSRDLMCTSDKKIYESWESSNLWKVVTLN
jgi:hypothetical protein